MIVKEADATDLPVSQSETMSLRLMLFDGDDLEAAMAAIG